MKYHFNNEDKFIDFSNLLNFFGIKAKDKPGKETVGLSRTEDYFIYNLNESKTQSENNNENENVNANENKIENKSITFATIYLRADNRKTEIIRKYQNFLNFLLYFYFHNKN